MNFPEPKIWAERKPAIQVAAAERKRTIAARRFESREEIPCARKLSMPHESICRDRIPKLQTCSHTSQFQDRLQRRA
jgi:hypothetical protein